MKNNKRMCAKAQGYTGTLTALTLLIMIGLPGGAQGDQTTHYTYNMLGLVETIDGPRVDVSDITTFGYDTQGNRTSITNALGHATQITEHDGSGRPLTIVDTNGVTTQLIYDPRGRLLTRTTDGQTTTMTYDGVGNVTSIIQADGSSLNYEYDAAHRLTALSDGLGKRIQYTLDNAGNRTQEQVFDQTSTLKRTHSSVFNELSQMIQGIGAGNQTTTYSYDPNGNMTGRVDAKSNPTTQAFDALNRLTQSTDALNGITQYRYDARDNLVSVTDLKGLTTTYVYDAFDNLISQTSPDTGLTTYTYDEAGNRLTKTDARGITATYTYDALNRVTTIRFPDSSLNITYTYDQGENGIGRLTGMQDGSGHSQYSYDSHGNLLNHTRFQGNIVTFSEYTYDHENRIESVMYPSERLVTYTRNSQGQVTAVSLTEPDFTTTAIAENITYAPFGSATGWTYGNGLTANVDLDLDYQTRKISVGSRFDRDYTHDPVGNITDIVDLEVAGNSQTLSYDALDRLINANGGYGFVGYGHDAVGNRTSYSNNGSLSHYAYAVDSHQLQSIAGPSPESRTYDAMGNTLQIGSRQFNYDDTGRLSQVDSGGITASYAYNGKGERVIKTVGGETTHYLYNPAGQLLAELDDNQEAIREYIYLNGQPLAMVGRAPMGAGSVLYYMHNDHLGTPQVMTDTAGTVVWHGQYRPFGQVDEVVNTVENPLRFPGQYFDAETGLHYNYFRTYDPSTGRYLESDPIGLDGGLNTYLYVNANPLRFTDPRGLDNVGCTTDPLTIDGRCKRICCAIHDKCYDDNSCTADSWTSDSGCNAEACDNCNKEVVKCFVWCDQAEPMGIEPAPGTPEYYCPAQHRYIKIPGDFPTVEAAKAVCGS
jgi:RHS repeat-associated protein